MDAGLRAQYDIVEISGGSKHYLEFAHKSAPPQFVVIAVNAATDPIYEMDKTNEQPSISESINAVSGVAAQPK